MSGNLYLSAAGAEARMRQLDTLANNMANAGTTGFREDRVVFEAAMETALMDSGGPIAGGRTFVGTQMGASRMSSGPVENTGRALDVAIQGPGFFVVETDAGARYTRAGAFQVDPSGQLVTAEGHPVLGEGGAISVGPRPVSISSDGSIVDDEGTVLGRLRVDDFAEPERLTKEGANLMRAPALAVSIPVDAPTFATRSLEGSNVQTVTALAQMVVVQRAFDASMKTLEAEDAATSRLLQEI
jgi:flagellar basal-body rod protein FlgF